MKEKVWGEIRSVQRGRRWRPGRGREGAGGASSCCGRSEPRAGPLRAPAREVTRSHYRGG